MITPLLVALLVFLALAGAILMMGSSAQTEREMLQRRLADIPVAQQRASLQSALSIVRQTTYSRIPWLDAMLHGLDLADRLSQNLRRAGVPMRAGEFLLVQGVVAAAVAYAFSLLFGGGWSGLIAAAPGAIVGFMAPLLWLRLKRAQRLNAFERALPDSLDLVVGSLRAGHGLAHGLDLVARETTGPCSEEFGQVLQELNLGEDLEVALARLVERMGSEDARLLATAIAVQRRTGGNLVDVISQMSHTIRERLRMRQEVHTITTAPRVSGYVVGLLPVLTVVGMYFTSPYYVEMLVTEPLGRIASIVSGCMVLIGLYLNHRIAQVEM